MEFTIMHADHIAFQFEMILYGMTLPVCSELLFFNLNKLAGFYVALSISHLTILHARRAKTWRFGYQVFTSIVLFLNTTIVRPSSLNILVLLLILALSTWERTLQLPRLLIMAQRPS